MRDMPAFAPVQWTLLVPEHLIGFDSFFVNGSLEQYLYQPERRT